MINNINTLQNLPESSGLYTYTDLYLKQSLANLGQRFSSKGDGLYTSEFSICDILDIDYNEEVHKYSYALINIKTEYEVESTNSDILITLSYIDNNSIVNPIKTISLEGIFPYKTTYNIETNGSPINYIKYYESGGYIKKLDNEYITAFAGYNSKNEIREITIDSFLVNNSISDRLCSGIRFFSSYNGKNDKGEDLHTIKALSSELLISRQNEYSFTLYDVIYDGTFEEFKQFIYDEVIVDTKSLSVDNVINSLLENGILVVHKDKSGNKWENKICNCTDQGTGQVTFNNLDTDSLEGDFDLKNEVSNTAIMFSYDIAVFYPLICEYYNNAMYSDNIELKKKIVAKIAKQIFDDYNKEFTKFATSKNTEIDTALTDFTVNSLDICLPLNYKFIYSCNSNNNAQIYNSIYDISVEYTVDLKKEIYKILQGDKSEQILICSIPDTISIDNKFNVYCFSVTYSKDNIVDDINVRKKFTLPYIDENGYWRINDISTPIYARGKDGGQPNIIMTYTNTYTNTNKVISSFKRDEITNLDWQPTKVRIRPLDDNNNIEASSYHILNTMMPVNINSLNENLITLLEHAIILNINSVQSESVDESTSSITLADGLGKNSVITTFWALEKVQDKEAIGTENNKYKYVFSYVKQPDTDWAVDMNYLSNSEDIVKHYMGEFGVDPDKYEHSWLVFDKINTSFKNNTNTKNVTVWPVFMNQLRDKYVDTLGYIDAASTQYNNDLNITIGFYDNITKANNTGYITGIGQDLDSKKYFYVNEKSQLLSYVKYNKYAYEFLPNAHFEENSNTMVPTLDLSEIFVRNQTTFNRQNILSVNDKGYIYYAYIGSSYDLPDKQILHIGTSHTNPNIGEVTLMDHGQKSHFAMMQQINIDFKNIQLNGNVVTTGSSWNLYTNNEGKNAWHMTMPVGYIGELYKASENTDNISNVLMYNKEVTIMEGFSLPGGDVVPAHTENISYLNLSYFFENVAKINDNKNYIFKGDFVQYVNNCYFLQLQTDIEKSSILTDEDNYKYLLTNPIEFSYTNNSNKTIVNVREIVSNTSQPAMFTNENL